MKAAYKRHATCYIPVSVVQYLQNTLYSLVSIQTKTMTGFGYLNLTRKEFIFFLKGEGIIVQFDLKLLHF